MYKDLFDENKQEEMRNFFLNIAAPLGKTKTYFKNCEIALPCCPSVCIVTKGKVRVSLYGEKGLDKLLHFLIPGEIFGELNYFENVEHNIIVFAKEDTTISIVDQNTLNSLLKEHPEYYTYFIHSISRKYFLSLCHISDILFHSSISKVANTLYRLSCLTSSSCEKVDDVHVLPISLTHHELATLVGCSRITITRILATFKEEGILYSQNKTLVITDIKKLQSYIESD